MLYIIKFNGVSYRGVFFRQANDNGEKKMTFTAIGKNNLNLWGGSVFTSIGLAVSWPKAISTKSLSAPITVKAGQTYDGYEINGNKWVKFDRRRTNLGDCGSLSGVKMNAFILKKRVTLKIAILGWYSIKHAHYI